MIKEAARYNPEREPFKGLILIRKIRGGVVLSNRVLVTVLGIEHDRARFGIMGPEAVHVYREELESHDKEVLDPETVGRLVIVRKVDQGIKIGDVLLRNLGIERNKVKIGIKAPEEIKVLRSELSKPDLIESFIQTGENKDQVFTR